MKITPRLYRPSDAAAWDTFVGQSWNGTFLHSRKFLSYHGSRFQDISLMIEDGQRLVGVFPAAIDPNVTHHIVSHPGSTYGGMIHGGRLRGQRMIDALVATASWYRAEGFASLTYKVVPSIFQKIVTADDVYGLFRLGARRSRSEINAAIEYRSQAPLSTLRARKRRLAEKSGLVIARGVHYLDDYWSLLEHHLDTKFKVAPTHSLREMYTLYAMFPDAIECVVALLEGDIVAGIILFHHPHSVHLQYSAADATGYKFSALDLLLQHSIEAGERAGKWYFSFGTSCEEDGKVLNSGLYQFKNGFGAGSAVHEFYDLPLTANLNTECD